MHVIIVIIKVIAALCLVALISGCSSSTGWRFEVGVSPVKQLDNHAGLQQTDGDNEQVKGKY